MINYDLPQEIEIDGTSYPINKKGDYRLILDIISVLNDNELSEKYRAVVALNLFYDFNVPYDGQTALEKMFEFINLGEKKDENNEPEKNSMPVMDWEQDFNLYIPPINKVLGYEVRATPFMHWWTFVGCYMEIDENSTFSRVVDIRQKLKHGKKLDADERAFYQKNRKLVDIKQKLTEEDKDWLYGGDDSE